MLVNLYYDIKQSLEGDEELLVYFRLKLSKRSNLTLFFESIKDFEPKIIRKIILNLRVIEDEEEKYRRRKEIS